MSFLVAKFAFLIFAISLIEYSIKRLKNSIQRKSKLENHHYDLVVYEGHDMYNNFSIHNESVVRFTRIISYFVISIFLGLMIISAGIISEEVENLRWLQELWSARDLFGVGLLLDIIQAVDKILPFELLALIQPSILKSILIATIILLWVSSLQNGQMLAQFSAASTYERSDIERIELADEWDKYKKLIRVVSHHLNIGKLEDMRGQLLVIILFFLLYIFAGSLLVYFYSWFVANI